MALMEPEKDAYYVVKKGDIVGIYKSLIDVQSLLGSSVSDGSISVYKGYYLPKKSEEYLASHGLKNAAYSIEAVDVNDNIFGKLFPCPYMQPDSSRGKASYQNSPSSRFLPVVESWNHQSCIVEFDGAAKGNPGPAGAGAVLRAADGSKVYLLREGVGNATNNVAEYRAVILGLRQALIKGYKHICVQGDSLLVCNQIQGLWKTKNQNMADLCKIAKELREKFLSFEIKHIPRELNSVADAQANLAINLKPGQFEEVLE